MPHVDGLAHVLTAAAVAALVLFAVRVWREHPERVSTRGLAGTAALVALSALLAGYLLTMPQALGVRVFLVVYARVSVIATVALAGLAGMRAARPRRKAGRRSCLVAGRAPHRVPEDR